MSWQIIGDLHIDAKEETIDEKIEILSNILDNDCENVVIAGDVFNTRDKISSLALNKLQELFQKYRNKDFYLIVGNHDCKNKNTLYPNSLEASFGYMDFNISVIDMPIEIDDFLLVPWICDDNYTECIDAIKTSKAKYCVGHFAINTFLMTRGIECRGSLKVSDFKNFEKVFSGHFHLRQEKKNIIYVGSLTQDTWTDFEDQKGYYVVDDDIKFVEGPKQIYKHLVLEDKKTKIIIDKYKDCHVKLYHKEKLSKKQFDVWEELKKDLRSFHVFDESQVTEIEDKEIDKVDFSEMLNEFFEEQDEIEDDFKKDIKEYLILKEKEIG